MMMMMMMMRVPRAGGDPPPGPAAHGNFPGRCKQQRVLATGMLNRNREAPLLV